MPVEVDQIYASLAKLATALGPNGANKRGALSRPDQDRRGEPVRQRQYLPQMITEFSGLSETLGGSAGNLFASIS